LNNSKQIYQVSSLAVRRILLASIMVLFTTAILYFLGVFNQSTVTAQQFVNLQEGEAPNPGFRRAHAKGICIAGTFESNGSLDRYSLAKVFDEGSTPFLGRFSIGGNNPTAPDLKSPVRSMAFTLLSTDNQEWRVAMNTPPVMAVATPEAFFEQLQALTSPPAIKPSKLKAFFASHPESKAFNEWASAYVPTNSFSTELYHSINAFYLVDDAGNKQATRWVAVPQLASDMPLLNTNSPNALQEQLTALLKKGTVNFSLIFTLADDLDDENNPTIPWPHQRKQINAGTLVITSSEAQNTGLCAQKNFDPLVLPEGIEATEDPILRARSSAYSESYRRRARETLLGTKPTSVQE